jgi:DNA repair photolyase
VLLRHELRKASRRDAIAMGTATDAYQPAERRFGRTRAVWQVFAAERGWRLSVTTKSDLILRDLELLKEVARANVLHVYLTITTLDEKLARVLEPRAPRPALRLGVIERLAAAGLSVGAFPNPILPLLTDSEKNLDAVAGGVARSGGRFFGGGLLFLMPSTERFFFDFLAARFPRLLPEYKRLFRNGAWLRGAYADTIAGRVAAVRSRHGLAGSPSDYTPELGAGVEQLSLFSEGASEWTSRNSTTNCLTG